MGGQSHTQMGPNPPHDAVQLPNSTNTSVVEECGLNTAQSHLHSQITLAGV